MSKMNKFHFILEIVWLIVGSFALLAACYELYKNGFDESKQMFLISIIAFAIYTIRRYSRKIRK